MKDRRGEKGGGGGHRDLEGPGCGGTGKGTRVRTIMWIRHAPTGITNAATFKLGTANSTSTRASRMISCSCWHVMVAYAGTDGGIGMQNRFASRGTQMPDFGAILPRTCNSGPKTFKRNPSLCSAGELCRRRGVYMRIAHTAFHSAPWPEIGGCLQWQGINDTHDAGADDAAQRPDPVFEEVVEIQGARSLVAWNGGEKHLEGSKHKDGRLGVRPVTATKTLRHPQQDGWRETSGIG